MVHDVCDGDTRITDDPEALDLLQAHGWIASSYWAEGIPFETFRRSVEHSMVVSVHLNGRQVGFARAVTDRATFVWVCDVWIDAEARGRGLGKRLMAYLTGHPELQGLRRWSLATRDAHELYRQYGFEEADPVRGMQKLDPEIYRRNLGREDVR